MKTSWSTTQLNCVHDRCNWVVVVAAEQVASVQNDPTVACRYQTDLRPDAIYRDTTAVAASNKVRR